jgi:dUTP pyrophosphatase
MSSVPVVGVLRLAGNSDLPLPTYMSAGASGADLCAAVEQPVVLAPGERAFIPTGFALSIPVGFEVQIRPRSGLALRAGVTLLNAPGTIDCDYRGPVGLVMVNLGQAAFTVNRGDRVAQMIVAPVARAVFSEIASLDETERASGGFGSTGNAAEQPR